MKCPKPKCSGWICPIDIVKMDDRKYHDVVHKCNECEYAEYKPLKENKINNKIGIPFEKLYNATPHEVYKDDIKKFFMDEIHDIYQYFTRKDGIQVAKGFIWIANHGTFSTLTVEPMDGSQFEIAVRIHERDPNFCQNRFYKYSGYSISKIPYAMIGKDTGGH